MQTEGFRSATMAAALLGLVHGIGSAQQVSDGFDYPVGPPSVTEANDGDGYYNSQNFGTNNHLGEDWNGKGGADTDLGDPVYAISNGLVVSAKNEGSEWGNVVIIEHELPDGSVVRSLYAHLDEIGIGSGEVLRGEQLGTIGRGYFHGTEDPDGVPNSGDEVDVYDYSGAAHLHFEMRTDPSIGLGRGYSSNIAGYVDPSEFIDGHRPQPAQGIETTFNRNVSGGKFAVGIAVSQDGQQLYFPTIVNQFFGLNPLDVIRTSDFERTARIPIDLNLRGVAANPNGDFVYVATGPFFPGRVVVIRRSDKTIIKTIFVPGVPWALASSPDGEFLYVTDDAVGSSLVTVIRTSDHTVQDFVNGVGSRSRGIAVSPDGSVAYASSFADGTVSVIDTATSNVTATIPIGGPLEGVAVSPNGKHAYVAGTDHFLHVIQTSDNTVLPSIPLGGPAHTVAFIPGGDFAYVGAGFLEVMRTSDHSVADTIAEDGDGTANDFYAVAVSPNKNEVYVTNSLDGKVSVFSYTAPLPFIQLTDTTSPTTHANPVISNDGTKVAFTRRTSTSPDDSALFVAGADGSNPVKIAPALLHSFSLPASLASSGTRVAFSARPTVFTGNSIFVSNSDNTGLQEIVLVAKHPGAPVMSSDGSTIAFNARPDPFGNKQIRAIDSDGSNERLLVEACCQNVGGVGVGQHGITGDGTKIAFSFIRSLLSPMTNDVSRWRVGLINTDGTSFVPPVDPNLNVALQGPVMSDDGSTIVFATPSSLFGTTVFAVDGDGTNLRVLFQEPIINFPVLTADGSQLVYTRSGGLFIRNVDGSGIPQQITPFNSTLEPSVNGDGRKIVFLSLDDLAGTGQNADGNMEVFLANVPVP